MNLGESLIAQVVWKACDHGGDREKGEGVDCMIQLGFRDGMDSI